MKRLSSTVSHRVVATTALQVAPVALTAVRTFEYWGLWVSVRTQPYCLGDKLPQLTSIHGIANPSKEGQFLTGNIANAAYTDEMIRNPAAELQIISRNHRFYNGHQKYVVSPATAKDVNLTRDTYNKMMADEKQKELMWTILLKNFPSLKTPLDDATKQKFVEFYGAIIDNALDEVAVDAIAKPFCQTMHETKYISSTYWWRFAEALMEALEAQVTMQRSAKRSYRVTVERVTKIAINTLGDHPWSHDETSSPYLFDVSGHRAMHEAGFW